jgi:hypothetical protein
MSERKFKVKVIKHQLKNNAVAVHGEIVSEGQLKYNISELIKDGFIEEFQLENEVEQPTNNESVFSEMTKAELIQYANDNDIEIDPLKKKEVIIEAIENHMKSIEVK